MPTSRTSRIGMSRLVLRILLGAAPIAALTCLSTDARAQLSGTTTRPIPNVLLLVDSSGSMERMSDNSLPSDNRNPSPEPANKCSPGVATNPNRWGMLLQALTGNMQPYYSCDEVLRTGAAFKNEFRTGPGAGYPVYDADYFLPWHRPLSGATAPTACTFAAKALPGAPNGSGIGPNRLGLGGDSKDFPPDAFQEVFNEYLHNQYLANSPLTNNTCVFEQTFDGQLDAARDYVRFGMMMFDNDTDPGIGVQFGVPTADAPSGNVNTLTNPFTGQWSYVKTPSNPFLSSTPSALAMGQPDGCTTGATAFEVGARHWAAPPWEGRMIPFPAPDAPLFDIQRTNDEIQKVLLGTRPYGATPIDGMLEDARDYLWYNPSGPLNNATPNDPYVGNGCRDQYIILLTDGAPNLDLRPSCEGTSAPLPANRGQCPFNKAATIADNLARGNGITNHRVRTFVIGFSVNGAGAAGNDGFPVGFSDCKTWYNAAAGGNGNPTQMQTACMAAAPAKGSTADACCQLNEIAWNGGYDPATGTHDIGPYFAETQADLVLSFGRILGGVSKSASTRTLPGYAPSVSIAGVGNTADYIASFIPNARKVWSGEIDRTRSTCASPVPAAQDANKGDSYASNLSDQATAKTRRFFSVKGPVVSGTIDSLRTLRPFADSTPADGILAPTGTIAEVTGIDQALAASTNWAEALEITDTTCKRTKAINDQKQTLNVPALSKNDCTDITWGFATAYSGPLSKTGPGPGGVAATYDFNVRCQAGGTPGVGTCSVSPTASPEACNLTAPTCTVPGAVCVPRCAALGAVYRSSPALVGPPNQYLRDDGYAQFQKDHATRRPTMFVATTDGFLHAFKALAVKGGFDDGNFELWAFAPPAVLPKLAANYPTGQQLLLDGTPVVKDIVWDRLPSATAATGVDSYHTTLAAGLGAGGPGYYALNVTDADCGGYPNPDCVTAFTPASQGPGDRPRAKNASNAVGNPKGPHFLWQLTDVPCDGSPCSTSGDPAKQTRKAKDGTEYVALFGRESGTPAITTVDVDPGDGDGKRQIGVVVLPGGLDGAPVKSGGVQLACPRGIVGYGYPALQYNFGDNGGGGLHGALKYRDYVRQWGPTCDAPVPGRGVTIVRADTGEILRHFGRKGTDPGKRDTPRKLWPVTTDTPFDSPIIGTPMVYPNIIGATAQKIFVGDADGTLWRIDVSSPNISNWRVTLFQDLIEEAPTSPTSQAARSQPVSIPPIISLDNAGSIVLNVATGDQENIVTGTEVNYVYSIAELRPTPTEPGRANVRWVRPLPASERVTGPMVVFDRTLYFATYVPAIPTPTTPGQSATCTNGGNPRLWGFDFVNPEVTNYRNGGVPRFCSLAAGSVDPITGVCGVYEPLGYQDPTTLYPDLKGAIIPGVTIRAQQSCATFDSAVGDPSITGLTSTRFDLYFGATTNRSSGATTGTPQAARTGLTRPLPRTTAVVDAWALVAD